MSFIFINKCEKRKFKPKNMIFFLHCHNRMFCGGNKSYSVLEWGCNTTKNGKSDVHWIPSGCAIVLSIVFIRDYLQCERVPLCLPFFFKNLSYTLITHWCFCFPSSPTQSPPSPCQSVFPIFPCYKKRATHHKLSSDLCLMGSLMWWYEWYFSLSRGRLKWTLINETLGGARGLRVAQPSLISFTVWAHHKMEKVIAEEEKHYGIKKKYPKLTAALYCSWYNCSW